MPQIIDHPGIPGAKQVVLTPSEPRPGGNVGVTVLLDLTRVKGTSGSPATINATVIASKSLTTVTPSVSPTDSEVTFGSVTGSGTTWSFPITVAKTGTYEVTRTIVVNVVAVDSTTGTGAASFVADDTPPPVPTSVTAVGVTSGIEIDWAAVTARDLSTYIVYSSTTIGGTYTEIGRTTAHTFTDTGLAAGATFFYKVSALDTVGNESALSSSGTASALGDIKLTLSLVKTRVGGSDTFQASLTADQTINSSWLIRTVSPTDTDITFGSVSPSGTGTNYTWNVIVSKATVGTFTRTVVVQIDTSLSSGKSGVAAASFIVDTQAPAAATGVTVVPRIQSARVTWTAPADLDIDYYLVYRNTTNSIPGTVYGKTIDTSFLDSAMDSNTQYFYWVKAVDTVGNIGPASSSGSGTTLQVITSDIQDAAIDLAKMASGSVDSAQIVAGAIGLTKFASGLTAPQITASLASITSPTQGMVAFLTTDNKLYRYTGTAWTKVVDGVDITAHSITAGQIAAAAISATEIAAAAITASKLGVTGTGAALNSDPGVSDIAAWTLIGGGAGSIQTVTDGKAGSSVLRSTLTTEYISNKVPYDPTKTYRVRGWVRNPTGANGVLYLGVGVYDHSGGFANGINFSYIAASGVTVPSSFSWFEYLGILPPQTWSSVPETISLVILLNYGGTLGYMEAQDIRLEEVLPGTLIQDGSISTDKIQANAVTALKIAAGSVTATKLATVSAAVDPGKFTNNSPSAGRVSWNNLVVVMDGNVYAPANGSTPDTQNYYIWFDRSANAVNTTVRSTAAPTLPSFDPSNDVLLGFTVSGVFNQVWSGTTITGDQILTGSILANHISVNNLAAINADLGTITAGIIQDAPTISTTKGIRLSTSYGIPTHWNDDGGVFIDLASAFGVQNTFMKVGQALRIDWSSSTSVSATFKGVITADGLTGASASFTGNVAAGGINTAGIVMQSNGLSQGFNIAGKARAVYGANDSWTVYADALISTASSGTGNTTTTLNDDNQLWGKDQFAGNSYLTLLNSGAQTGEVRLITNNTRTQLVVSPAFSGAPSATAQYKIDNVRNFTIDSYLTTIGGTSTLVSHQDSTWTPTSNTDISRTTSGTTLPSSANAGPVSGDTIADGGGVRSATGDYTITWQQTLDTTGASITNGWTSVTGVAHLYYRTSSGGAWVDTGLEQAQNDAWNSGSGHSFTVNQSLIFNVPSNPSYVEFKLVPGVTLGWTGGTFTGGVTARIVGNSAKVTWNTFTAGTGTQVIRRNPRLFSNSFWTGSALNFAPHLTMEPLSVKPSDSLGREGDIVFAAGSLHVHNGTAWFAIGSVASSSYVLKTGDVMGSGARLEFPTLTTNSQVAIGTIEFQGYALSNAWLGENIYFDGSNFRRRQTGAAHQIYFNNGAIELRLAGNAAAGSVATTTVAASFSLSTFLLNQGSMVPSASTGYAQRISAGGNDQLTFGADGSNAYIQSWNSKPLWLNNQGNPVIVGSILRVGGNGSNGTTGDVVARRSSTTGAYYFGDSPYAYLYFDGTNFNFGNGSGPSATAYLTTVGGFYHPTHFDSTSNTLLGGWAVSSDFTAQGYINTNYHFGLGLVGNYDPTKWRLIYGLGSPYLPNTNGVALGTGGGDANNGNGVYGLFYAYDALSGGQNATGHALSHGIALVSTQVVQSYIGSGIYTIGPIYGNSLAVAGNATAGGQITGASLLISGAATIGSATIGGYSVPAIRSGSATSVPGDLVAGQLYFGF